MKTPNVSLAALIWLQLFQTSCFDLASTASSQLIIDETAKDKKQ
jgi:hypothetical protein